MLPLFPLGIVLFPESVIQLHIFEEKYKKLINDCIGKDTEFGINPIMGGKIKDIGCSAKVVEVLKRYPDGKMDVLVRGMKKYRLNSYKLSEKEYLLGDIDFIEEDFEYPDTNLLEECVQYYNKIAEDVPYLRLDKVESAMFYSVTPSYFFAQKTGLTRRQKYKLLELSSENLRLKFLLEHLKEIEPMLQEAETIQRLIKNDGYAKRM